MNLDQENMGAAQTAAESHAFIEAFAKVTVSHIRDAIGTPLMEVAAAEEDLTPNWDDPAKLVESGVAAAMVDAVTRAGKRYLHIDVAASPNGARARQLFLGLTGLSDKQQRTLYPALRSRTPVDRERLSLEVARLNSWLDELRVDGFDPAMFITYQRSIGIHGQTQNLSGAIGAAGAVIAFVDAIRELQPDAIVDSVGELSPPHVRSPTEVYHWLRGSEDRTVRALLLKNGRAVVFASSKDANILSRLDARASLALKMPWRVSMPLPQISVSERRGSTNMPWARSRPRPIRLICMSGWAWRPERPRLSCGRIASL